MAAERTLVLLKPDAVQRGLTGKVIDRLESAGLKIAGMKLLQVDDDLASQHYAEHADKPFYKGLVTFITSGPVVAMCLEGPGAIALTRKLMGSTNPAEATPGTIRGDFALDIGRNIIHGSADEGDAQREVSLFFSEGELLDYARDTDPWIVE